MSGDWIKFETVTPDKPEVYRIAETLNIDPDAVIGKLIRIWIWADQQTIDGNARSVTKMLIDRVTGVPGFADSMLSAGWLKQGKHGLSFPNFDRHNGNSAKNRALTNKRVKRKRNADGVTDALLEKIREESIPDGIDKAAFIKYFEYRQAMQKRSRLTEEACRLAFKLLAKHPFETQRQMIETSIMSGWTGLFPPKGAANAKDKRSGNNSGHQTTAQRMQENFARLKSGGENLDGGGADIR